jgi:hypothetical protein
MGLSVANFCDEEEMGGIVPPILGVDKMSHARKQSNWEFDIFAVGPSNDHELEIAREVDRLSLQDRLFADAVPELLTLLDFRVSGTDYEFLKRYIEWRIDNPIVK